MPKPENASWAEEELADAIFPLIDPTDVDDEPEDHDEPDGVEDADATRVFDESPAPPDPTLNAVSEATPPIEAASPQEITVEQLVTIPPSPDHQSFLSSLPTGEFGFSLGVYADRVEEDGLLDAAQVLRHHDAYLAYLKHVRTLHRAICAQIERIFGCRYAPEREVSDSPEPACDSAHPNRLYIRTSSLRCFRDWPPLSDSRVGRAEPERLLRKFEQRITTLHPTETRYLIVRKRPLRYEVVLLPLLLAYLSGLPSEITTTNPQASSQTS